MKNEEESQPLALTAIVVGNDMDGYHSYFLEFSEVTARGKTPVEAEENLMKNLRNWFELKMEEFGKQKPVRFNLSYGNFGPAMAEA